MPFREPMRRVDAAWLRMDRPENTADIVALLGMAEPVAFRRVLSMVEEKLLSLRRFRQRIQDPGLGAAAWEDDPGFDLARHVDRVELPAGAVALRRHLGALASSTFEPGRPPWRVQVLGLGRGRSALAFKIHHCVGDGRALVRVLLGMTDEAAPAAPPPPGRAFQGLQITREPLELARQAITDPGRALALAGEAAAFGASLARLALLPLDRTPGLARPLCGTRLVAWTAGFPVAEVSGVARHAGATANELLMAAIAGGLRRVLPAHPGEDEPRAMVPVDARAPEDGAMGNAFGLVFLQLPTRSKTPAERLDAVRERFARIRRSPDAAVTLAVLAAFGLLPKQLEHLATGFFSRKASLVVTNVRGPAAPVQLAGASVERMMFWVPHPATLGLGVSILSYAGVIRVGVRADVSLLVDPAELAHAVGAELALLGVAPQPEPGRRTPRGWRGRERAEPAPPAPDAAAEAPTPL